MVLWLYNTDMGKSKQSKKNLSQSHFSHHMTYRDRLEDRTENSVKQTALSV
jgi:hypothetical protein